MTTPPLPPLNRSPESGDEDEAKLLLFLSGEFDIKWFEEETERIKLHADGEKAKRLDFLSEELKLLADVEDAKRRKLPSSSRHREIEGDRKKIKGKKIKDVSEELQLEIAPLVDFFNNFADDFDDSDID